MGAATLKALLQDIPFAMLTTVEPDGSLRSRPMAVRPNEGGDELWFLTSLDSPKIEEVQQDRHVNVALAAPDENRFVSISGFASVVQDRSRIEELWTPAYQAWLPKGKDDPNLALLRVRVAHAEFWDPAASRMVLVAGLAKSMPIGKTKRPGEYHQLSFDEDAGRTSAYAHDNRESRVDPKTNIIHPIDESPD